MRVRSVCNSPARPGIGDANCQYSFKLNMHSHLRLHTTKIDTWLRDLVNVEGKFDWRSPHAQPPCISVLLEFCQTLRKGASVGTILMALRCRRLPLPRRPTHT
jgi:hypothetical protein